MGRFAIFYLMSHSPHLPYLLVSLYQLRKHYLGPVLIYAWDCPCSKCTRFKEGCGMSLVEVCRHLADCFDAFGREWTPGGSGWVGENYRGKNDQFLCKQQIARSLDGEYQRVMYLDADTMIQRDPYVFMGGLDHEHDFVATQFNNWDTGGGTIKARISRLKGFPEIDQQLVDLTLSIPYPSVNGGVWCCRPNTNVLDTWYKWSYAAREVFIADETVLHLLPRKFPNIKVVHGWNTSPKKKYQDIPDDEVKIWHFHGDSNVRPNKSPEGVKLWYPVYDECKRKNIGNVNRWAPHVGNKWLTELERELV